MASDRVGIVFLDRDGTINFDPGYLRSTDGLKLLPGAASAIADLKRAGFVVVVVSNQSAVGRGIATIEEVEAVNRRIAELLCEEEAAAELDLTVYAPDHPDTAGDRRKPGIGMLRDVERLWQWDPQRSWMIGDRLSDMEFGRNAGLPPAHCLLIKEQTAKQPEGGCWARIYPDLRSAVDALLAAVGR